ncbi:TPA: hypothetical protein ACSP82_002855 [Aeromonas veronii]
MSKGKSEAYLKVNSGIPLNQRRDNSNRAIASLSDTNRQSGGRFFAWMPTGMCHFRAVAMARENWIKAYCRELSFPCGSHGILLAVDSLAYKR